MNAPLRMVAAVALVLAGAVASAQTDPDTERGARPGLSYALTDFDQVNLFNGTMTMNLPIGPAYHVNGALAYRFMASYATNTWQTEDSQLPDGSGDFRDVHYTIPSEHDNAGFGWLVTLGSIIETPLGRLAYLAPDGGQHEFFDQLHPLDTNEPDDNGAIRYTTDGTYLRLKVIASVYQIDFPNGEIHTFDANRRLTGIQDQFGNWVHVTYASDGSRYDVTDSVGRSHTVYFTSISEYDQIPFDGSTPTPSTRWIVDKVVLAAFDEDPNDSSSVTAQYQFSYLLPPPPGVSAPTSQRLSRRCARLPDSSVAGYVVTPILTSIDLPESVQYQFDYDYGNHSTCSSTNNNGASGNLIKLTLPTGGRVEWTYFAYGMGTGGGVNAGVHERTVYDGTIPLGRTEYQKGYFCQDAASSSPFCYIDLWRRIVHREGADFELIVDATKHYFSAYRSSWHPGNGAEYGLPLTRRYPLSSDPTAFLSTEVEQYNPADGQFYPTGRKTWVRYEGDQRLTSAGWFQANQRVAFQRIDYEDGKFADVTYSDFDGLGHYRKAITGGNFLSGNVSTTFTNFNPGSGRYKLDSNGALMSGSGHFNLPSSTSPWILKTFDRQWSSDGTSNATRIGVSCFDSAGFMTSRRTFKNFAAAPTTQAPDPPVPTATTQDLLAVFTRNTEGNLVREQYFGGDAGSSAPTSYACGGTLSGESYAIAHVYQYGSLKTSKHEQAENTFDLADNEIDLNTGLVSKSHRFRTDGSSDGIDTTYNYDKLGRLKEVKGPTSRTNYVYQNQPPKITVSDYDIKSSPVLVRSNSVELDVLGRSIRETRSMPGSVTAERKTKYNSLGWKLEVTDWGASAPTVFTYDLFGRVKTIKTPDQSDDTALKILYTGVSQVERTSKVRTSGDATALQSSNLSDAVTTEQYDRMGRLVRIVEPKDGATQAAVSPVTEYGYDVAGHLISVCAKGATTGCVQPRTFSYDNRGFLLSETHPENGTATYAAYDARGHLRRRYLGQQNSPFQHLGFVYDRAERLTQIHEADVNGNESRKLKLFTYWGSNGANGTGDKSIGRLALAIRFNWITFTAIAYNVEVIERYAYQDSNGSTSSRNTKDFVCQITSSRPCTALDANSQLSSVSLDREFTQTFTYDALGETHEVGYPKCQNCPGTIADRTSTNAYDNGFLTSVTWPGSADANTLTYHSSGLLNTVQHSNGVIDQQTIDLSVPSRPLSLITTNARSGATCVAPSFSLQPSSRNVPANTPFTLYSAASGEDNHAISYQWYRGNAPDKSSPVSGGNSASLTLSLGLGSTTSFWVEAKNDCNTSGTASVTATVTVCTTPSVTVPPDRTITRGGSTVIEATGSGSGTLHYQWYTVVNNVPSAIVGQTSPSLSASPQLTTRYRIVVTNDCDTTASADVVITVAAPPTTPVMLSVVYDSGFNKIQWTPSSSVPGVDHYVIERRPDNVTMVTSDGTITAIQDNPYGGIGVDGRTFVYRVKAVDVNGVDSEFGAYDLTTRMTFADDPIRLPNDNGGTPIRGVHVSDLRKAIDAVRYAAGLPPAWTNYNPQTGVVYASYFRELRDRLNEARALFGLPEVNFTDSVAAHQLIRGRSVTELRNGVK